MTLNRIEVSRTIPLIADTQVKTEKLDEAVGELREKIVLANADGWQSTKITLRTSQDDLANTLTITVRMDMTKEERV